MSSLTHHQHDRLLLAEEQEERDQQRAARSALRGVPIPRAPEGAIPRDVYPEPPPLLPEPEPIDLTAGTGAEQDAWATKHEEERLRKYAEAEAVAELDQLRLQAMEADAIVPPKFGGEPVRRDVRANFYWQATTGR